jgi:hypothetical protein
MAFSAFKQAGRQLNLSFWDLFDTALSPIGKPLNLPLVFLEKDFHLHLYIFRRMGIIDT